MLGRYPERREAPHQTDMTPTRSRSLDTACCASASTRRHGDRPFGLQESVDRGRPEDHGRRPCCRSELRAKRFPRGRRSRRALHHRHVVGIPRRRPRRRPSPHRDGVPGGGPVLPKDGSSARAASALRSARSPGHELRAGKRFQHRDVKPDNILLRDDGSAALTDLSVSRARP